jgi:hypothetical protein
MLTDIAAAAAILLICGAIIDLGVPHGVGAAASALLTFSFIASEMLARRAGFKITGFVLALAAALACALIGQFAVVSIAAFDQAPDITRQFFAPLTVGAIFACVGALAHRARYHVPFSLIIAVAAGLYAVFGVMKLSFGNVGLRL